MLFVCIVPYAFSLLVNSKWKFCSAVLQHAQLYSYLVGTDVSTSPSSEMPCRALRLEMAYYLPNNRCLHRLASWSKNTGRPHKRWWLASWITIDKLQCRCTGNKERIRQLYFYFSEFIIYILFYNDILMLKLLLCSFLFQSF